MRKRSQKKNVDQSFSQDQQFDEVDQDSLNEDYVSKKRAVKKQSKAPKKKVGKKPVKRQMQEGQSSNSFSEQIIQFRHNDDEIKQHFRPAFIQRWNGIDNQLQIFAEQFDDMSPMFKVYWQTKCKNMNAIIFVQIGKMQFFAFENDAIKLNQIFKKKLKKYSSFLMVNFWCKQIVVAKQQLFDRGIPVLMMNQIHDSKYRSQHGIIRRQIGQVITPAIHVDMEDKAYKQRWFMAFYIHDVKQSMSKRLGSKKQQNSIENVQEQLKKACVVLLDSQSNKFFIEEFQQDQKLHDVRRVMNRYRPVELLLPKSSSIYIKNMKQIARQICNPYIIQISYQRQNQRVNQTLQRFIKSSKAPLFKYLLETSIKTNKKDSSFQNYVTVKALDLVYTYLENMKLNQKIFDEGIFQLSCLNAAKLKPFFDSQVYQNLQVFRIRNQDEGQAKKGTLIAYIDYCLTNSGKKLLRKWLNQPLTNYQAIKQRQDCFKEIVQNGQFTKILAFHQRLIAYEKLQKNIADIYHWVVKGYAKNYNKLTEDLSFEKQYDQKKNPAVQRIKQIIRVLNLIGQFQKFLQELKQFNLKSKYWKKFTQISPLTLKDAKKVQRGQLKIQDIPNIKQIIQSITKKIDYNVTNDYLEPTAGHYPDFDKQKQQIKRIQDLLQKQLDKWKTHFNNNKISYASVRAKKQIQIPKGSLKKNQKPKQLVFSSQTISFQRYTTSKTNQLGDQLMHHQQKIAKSYQPFLNDIIEQFCQHKFIWNKYVEAISQIDVIFSIAQVCKRMTPRFLPKFCLDDQNSVLSIKKAYHPGLIQVLQEKSLVNNTLEMKKQQRFLLLTGPNMGGKSTLLRQTCLLAILAQIGSYLPCQYYQSIVFDQIFCRIGSSDKIIEGKSTFYVQLQETHRILKQATSSSLVIVDELGRGTSTYDGMAIAEATIDFILGNIGCYTLFSTHYTPITRDFLSNEEVKCAKMSYKLIQSRQKDRQGKSNEQKLQFLYQVEPGVAEKSFANNVAKMVGLPNDILTQADKKAEWISQLHQQAQKKWKITKNLNYLVDVGILKQKERQIDV